MKTGLVRVARLLASVLFVGLAPLHARRSPAIGADSFRSQFSSVLERSQARDHQNPRRMPRQRLHPSTGLVPDVRLIYDTTFSLVTPNTVIRDALKA
jgi:hypothetical protein